MGQGLDGFFPNVGLALTARRTLPWGGKWMRILITGADQPLGGLAARALQSEHELRLTGTEARAPSGLEALSYTPADLREPEQVAPLVEGIDAVAHLALHPPLATPDAAAEKLALDVSARGMFVLLHAALAAGVRR